ncbi:MAG: hypothetical protein ACYS67_02085 [Planctomycetota bacterium]
MDRIDRMLYNSLVDDEASLELHANSSIRVPTSSMLRATIHTHGKSFAITPNGFINLHRCIYEFTEILGVKRKNLAILCCRAAEKIQSVPLQYCFTSALLVQAVAVIVSRATIYDLCTIADGIVIVIGAIAVVVIDEYELIKIIVGIDVGIGIVYFAAFAVADFVVVGVKECDVHIVNIIGQLCQAKVNGSYTEKMGGG